MPAIARSEPFRGQGPCPLGVCDGSGWILDHEATWPAPASAARQRLRRGRNRGVASVIPPQVTSGVSFDRPPVSTDMDADASNAQCRCAAGSTNLEANLDDGPRPLAVGRHRHRQDDAGDAGLQGGA